MPEKLYHSPGVDFSNSCSSRFFLFGVSSAEMGRRNRRRDDVDGGDDDSIDRDYSLERTEKEWLIRSSSKRLKSEINVSNTSLTSDNDANVDVGNSGKGIATLPSPTKGNKNEAASTSESDRIERARLKKLRQKERQREKKAARTAAAISTNEQLTRKLMTEEKKTASKDRILLQKNQQQQQFITLAKGVRYQDITIGKGHIIQDRKKTHVSYTLRSKSHTSGKILDSSGNFAFRFGKSEVIKGWDIGLMGMKVGGIRRLIVPPEAGYGYNKDVGAGRGGDLYFQIELLHVAP